MTTTATTSNVAGVLEKASDGMSIVDAAKALGVSSQTIRNWIERGVLPATRFGDKIVRIAPEDLAAIRRPA